MRSTAMDRPRTLTAARSVAAPAPPPTAEVLGVPLALTDYDGTLDWIDATVAAGRRGYVCVAATHTVMAAARRPGAARRRARRRLHGRRTASRWCGR